MNKNQFAKDLIDGSITKEQAAYLLELDKIGNPSIFFIKDESGELLPGEQAKKAMYNKLPEKYKSVFCAVEIDEQDSRL